MFTKKFSPGDILLILVNFVPLYCVWFEEWNALEVFIVYCLETVIVGFINIFKIALAAAFWQQPAVDRLSPQNYFFTSVFMVIFFIIHYGLFVFIQTQIFMGAANIGTNGSFFLRYSEMGNLLGSDGRMLLLIFIAYYSLDTITGFIIPGKYKRIPPVLVMFQPYGRIFVQQIIVIIGSMFLTFNLPKVFILIFVIIKIFSDMFISRFLSGKIREAAADINSGKVNG